MWPYTGTARESTQHTRTWDAVEKGTKKMQSGNTGRKAKAESEWPANNRADNRAE